MGKIVLALMLSLSLFFNAYLLSGDKSTDDGNVVAGVIDGDTIVLDDNKTRVRLRYVDAPESGMCGNKEATELLTKLTVGKKVRIEKIIPDQYGRGMGMVYVDNVLINKEMVASGWVRYHSDDTSEKEEIKKVSEETKAANSGVYGKCESTVAKNPKCAIKGNIDFPINKYTYHLPGCTQYVSAIVQEDKGEQWFCTEAEAKKAGYTKAKTCD